MLYLPSLPLPNLIGKDGRYSIFGAEGGKFSGEEIQLGKYYDDFEAKGTRYPMIDRDYKFVRS
jgi:hypothetical protein